MVESGLIIPDHVAVIMDGNRRPTTKRGQSIKEGHLAGAKRLEPTVNFLANKGVRHQTYYAFSEENWGRDPGEIADLFDVFRFFLQDDVVQRFIDSGIRLKTIGRYKKFPPDIVEGIEDIHRRSAHNDKAFLNIALGYGGDQEIAEAATEFALANPGKEITVFDINEHLYTREQPDVDLLIRTGGEQRLSNFMLWQAKYAELVFTDTFWPDFDIPELETILFDYSRRQRRFGK